MQISFSRGVGFEYSSKLKSKINSLNLFHENELNLSSKLNMLTNRRYEFAYVFVVISRLKVH